jgi:tetratricopeptide (TPR) repeat protein
MASVSTSPQSDFGVFVSYRRDDASGHAGRLADGLVRRFGADSVFLDVDSIEPGTDFVDALMGALACCRVALVVIGPAWLDAAAGEVRRLEDPDDFVRMEVEQAIAGGLRVVPVLVGGAVMPAAADLPAALQGFARCQAYELGDRAWSASSVVLFDAIEQWLTRAQSQVASSPMWSPQSVELAPSLAAAREAPMVGRDELLAELDASAAPSQPRLIALGGEPGAGKTRLAAELAARAHERGATVLLGRCHEDGVRPYEPFAEALAQLVRGIPVEKLGSFADRLARLLPARGDERDARRARLPPEGDDRIDLFDAVGELFALVADERSCVVVIDDLQWATLPTMQMLQHLLRWPEPVALTVVATYRDTELAANPTLAELVGTPGEAVRRVRLSGLTADDVSSLAPELDSSSVASLTQRAAGNALFITQVLRQAQADGGLDDVSMAIGDVIAARLRRLDAATIEVLETASVLGTTFEMPVLEQLLERELLDEVDATLAAGLIVEGDSARAEYAFVHGLVRDVLYGRLSSARRSRMHARAGDALALAPSADAAAAIAHHRIAAGPYADVPKACSAAIVAANAALASLVPEEAVAILDRAIRLTELGGDRWLRERIELRIVLAEALYDSTDEAGERSVANVAAVEARRLGDGKLFAKTAVTRSYGSASEADDLLALELLTEALERLPDDEVALRSQVLVMLGTVRIFSFGDRVGADAALEEGMRLAREAADPWVMAEVCPPALAQTGGLPDLDLRRGIVEEFDTALQAIGRTDPSVEMERLQIEVEGGELGWRSTFERLRSGPHTRARRTRLVIARVEAMVDLMQGSFEDVERRATWVIENAGSLSIYMTIAMLQIFLLRREQGRFDEIAPIAESIIAESPGLRAFDAAIALALLESGDRVRAGERLRGLTDDRDVRIPRDSTWSSGLFVMSECAARLDDQRLASLIAPKLAPYAGQLIVAGPLGGVLGAADRALGQLATVLGHQIEAIGHLTRAIELEERMGARPLAARTQYWLAAARLARGDDGDAERAAGLLGVVVGEAEVLGMPKLEQQAIELRHR